MQEKQAVSKRNTLQKRIIIEQVAKLANHPTAQQLYDSLHEKYPTISRATVYRVLSEAAEAGTLLHITVSGENHYDHNTCGHYHMKCKKCGEVSDVFMSRDPDIFDSVRGEGAEIENYTIEFFGICPSCSDTNNKQ